ncbi:MULTISPECIES: tetratricopeptide repeat protein [unclassified Candidatus Tisiphia]|uniref:tetratricopeptide repeat protein n=1 Tax=unclassified Candidatus Tisiphia TaxID=2996318 RepID=UPI00312CAB40
MTVFEKSEAIILANNLLENNDIKLAKFLSKEFAGYPIMIVQGAQLLNNVQGLGKKEYKEKIHQSTDKIKLNITLVINELKPSAKKLLNRIALINNQGFSKELLKIITDNQNTLDDDLYQLSKFALISNIELHEINPIFEMHDVIAQKISESASNNKAYLEDIITKLVGYVPKSVIKSRIFRSAKTMEENFEIILRNSKKYNLSIYKLMQLNSQLATQYNNSLNYYKLEKNIQWFNKINQQGKFKLWLMSNDEKYTYLKYMQKIGAYYANYLNYRMAIKYFIKAKEIFYNSNVKGYEVSKWTLFYNIMISNLALGQVQEAEKDIQIIEQMFNEGLIDKSDLGCIHHGKSRLFLVQGKYTESLEQNNKAIETFIKSGLDTDDLILMYTYIAKALILNYLKEYPKAYAQLKQVYNLFKTYKIQSLEILGTIYAEMARSELGLNKLDQTSYHVKQAISIFLTDERRNPKDADYSEDIGLALSYVIQGNILFAQDKIKEAIESYNKAYSIYYYVYRDNRKNVAQVSELYSQGAKASCKARNLFSYKFFGKSQVKEFGINHPNTVSMFKYCKKYNMGLWAEEQ